jgi:putative transposase
LSRAKLLSFANGRTTGVLPYSWLFGAFMSKLLRFDRPGDVIFVTAVTERRRVILRGWEELLLAKLNLFEKKESFALHAWIILPEHFHIIIEPKHSNVSSIIRKIKLSFSSDYRKMNNKNKLTIWQKRFYDHIIRDQRDFNYHINYIHYNPDKHGLVSNPFDWRYSSLNDFFKRGFYDKDWGVNTEIKFEGDFGE